MQWSLEAIGKPRLVEAWKDKTFGLGMHLQYFGSCLEECHSIR